MTRRRFMALLLCVLMALSALISLGYAAHMAAHPHACTGVDCPVCQFIAQVEQTLRGFGLILLCLIIGMISGRVRARLNASEATALPALDTPVSRMVRIND